jgi:bifunctional DNA-binding transcriptional regulator/antitoxin component of YhaV-PrlF toxin-antitoxin module
MSKKSPGAQDLKYEIITQQDENGDVLVPIPQVLLDKLKWKEGDVIDIGLDESGRFILRKTN